jgi:hypothetical protein
VIPIGSVTETPLHRVANEAGFRGRSGGIDPQAGVVLPEKLDDLTLRYTGLDCDIGEFFAEIEDPVHTFQMDDDAVVHHGDAGAIAPIESAADYVNGSVVTVRNPDAPLYFIPGRRSKNGGYFLAGLKGRGGKRS